MPRVLQTSCFQKPYLMKNTFLLVYRNAMTSFSHFDTSKYLLWQTVTTQTSQPPTQQAFSDRFWTILIHKYLNKRQCSFSVARERCDERRIAPWENWDSLYEDSKGTDQPTHLYKLVCCYTVGIHENISNWI